jgi:hypothetical protein
MAIRAPICEWLGIETSFYFTGLLLITMMLWVALKSRAAMGGAR